MTDTPTEPTARQPNKRSDPENGGRRVRVAPRIPERQRTSAWTFQLRVIKAMILRDMMSRHAGRRLNYLWEFVQQALIVTSLLVVFTVRGRTGSASLPLTVFICTGYPIYLGFMGMWGTASNACITSDALLMFPQITLMDIIISKVLLEAASQIVGYLMIVVGLVIILDAPLPADLLAVAMAYFSVMWIGFCVGLILGSTKRYYPVFEELLRPLKRLGIFISGVVILGAEVPYFARPYFFWNPIFKAIEIARESWYPAYRSPIFLPWDIVVTCVTMTALGFAIERITRRSSTA